MEQLPINLITTVNISVSPTFPARAGFGTLLCITKESGVLDVTERVRSYGDIASVLLDWSADTEVAKLATAYFSQAPKPTAFMAGIRYETAQAALLKCGSVLADQLDSFTGITDGSFKISVDGIEQEISGLDFSAATSMADIATAINAEVTGSVLYSTDHFEFTSDDTGADKFISYLTALGSGTDISVLLKGTQPLSVKGDGTDAETIAASLSALEEADSSWYGFAFTKEVRDLVVINTANAVETAADWAEARTKIFFTTSNSENTIKGSVETDICSVLKAKALSNTIVIYSSYIDQYPETSIAGRAFSVDFTEGNPSITLKFKQLPTISVESLSLSNKLALDGKNCNAFISIAGNTMLAEGKMVGGRFFDEVHGLAWLQNAIQTEVFGTLYTTNKVSYTDKGVAQLAQAVRKVLDEAVRGGLLAPGTDANGNFLGEGYVVTTVPVSKISQADKEARIYKGISFTALGAGAIHGVTVNGVFER